MDGLDGNPHGVDPDFAGTLDGRGISAALLALAYEQRTANLIALFSMENVADLNYGNLRYQIFNRLDLSRSPA